ncbi:MAG: hypothetical protein ACM335_02745 [Deltaproteobacteria bacterium]
MSSAGAYSGSQAPGEGSLKRSQPAENSSRQKHFPFESLDSQAPGITLNKETRAGLKAKAQ